MSKFVYTFYGKKLKEESIKQGVIPLNGEYTFDGMIQTHSHNLHKSSINR